MALTTIPVELVTLDDGVTITVDDNLDTLTLTSTDADASVGPVLNLYRNSSSPADSDIIGAIDYDGRNDNSQDVLYSRIIGVASDVSDGTEDGALYLQTIVAGTTRDRVSLLPTEIAVNDGGIDLDFRIESNNDANCFFIDGGNDRVILGSNTARTNYFNGSYGASLQIEGLATANRYVGIGVTGNSDDANGGYLALTKSRGTSVNSNTVVQAGDFLGTVSFHGADGTELVNGADVAAQVATTPGANDMPTNLLFRTTSDGAAAPTERMRVDYQGNVFINRTSGSFNADGTLIGASSGSYMYMERSAGTSNSVLYLHRRDGNGELVSFYESNSHEGGITVSGATVSYNGFTGTHDSSGSGVSLSTPVGTVLSTIDEEHKTDHAKVKVSDTASDKRVYGVLQVYKAEETDDTGNTKAEHAVVASVGVASVRVTGACAGGDLLESAGNGTAKVQSDDVIRSSTLGKVTIGNSNEEEKLVSCVMYCG